MGKLSTCMHNPTVGISAPTSNPGYRNITVSHSRQVPYMYICMLNVHEVISMGVSQITRHNERCFFKQAQFQTTYEKKKQPKNSQASAVCEYKEFASAD